MPRQLVRSVATRLGTWLATIGGAAGLVMLLVHLAPGDAIDLIPDGERLRPRLEAEWGLDQPLVVRWTHSMTRLTLGDLGTSIAYRPGQSVASVVGLPALRSLGWGGMALVLALVQALAMAWFGTGRGLWARQLVRLASVAPVFLLAHLAVHGLNELTFELMQGGWMERPGWFALPDQPSSLRTALAIALLALGSGTLTELHLELDGALRRIRASGYVEAARARGGPTWPHVWRNLLPELAILAAGRVAFLAGGLVILERVLLLNGAGSVLWQAALLRDTPVAVGVAVLAASVVASSRLAADAIRVTIDPRLRELEAT